MTKLGGSCERSGRWRFGEDIDDDRLERPRERTFSKLTSVVGEDMRFVFRLGFQRCMVLNREPSRDVSPRNGESELSCLLG